MQLQSGVQLVFGIFNTQSGRWYCRWHNTFCSTSLAQWFDRLIDAEKVLHHLPNREHLRIHSQFGLV
jgi:hypothetical protein